MTCRKWIVCLLALSLLLGMLPVEALAAPEPVCFTPTAAFTSHQWGGWKITKQATCTQTGQRVHVCERCGEKETETIPQTSHSYGNWTVAKKATCKAEGSRYRVCSVCGHKETEAIPKTSHSYGKWTVTKKATCKAEGSRYRVCSVCGYKQTGKIKKTDHTWGEWEIVKPANCKNPGSRKHTCTVCGKTETKTIKPKPNAHVWGDWVIRQEATCLKEGSQTHTCTLCKKKETKKIPALGHDFGAWQIITPAGPDTLGIRQRACARCGETEQEAIPYQGEAGLHLTSGKVTRVEPEGGYTDVYTVEMALQNTGEIPLHFALDATYDNGSGDEVITDYYIGYDPTADNILQPGETIAFQYVACTSPLYYDGEKRIVSRLVYAGGWSEETGQRANSIAPIYIPLPAENGLLLTVDNLHRAGQGENEVLTFDLTVTNQATGWSLIAASAERDVGPLTDQEGFIGWPAEGLVLGHGQSHTFSYYFQPTAEEVEQAKNGKLYPWVSRYITVQDTQGHAATVCIGTNIRTPQAALAHLDGILEGPAHLNTPEAADLPVSLTLRNIGDLPVTDPVVRGVLMTGSGKTLRTFALTPENGAALLQPEESASFALTAPIGAEDEMAALEDEEPLLRFVFWAEYNYAHPAEGPARGESNLWQQVIPVWDQVADPKNTYVFPILTGSFEDRVYHPGEKVWIDLTVENVNPEDTIEGIRFEWYPVAENGDIGDSPMVIDMPDITLMPGESYTLKHRYFFGVDQEEALKGTYILDFHAWCHSVTYDWNSNCDWHGLIRMEPDEEDGLSVDVTFDPGEYHIYPYDPGGAWQTVEEVQGSSEPGYYPGDVSGHTGEAIQTPMHPLPDGFYAQVNVNNNSDEELDVTVSSDHPEDLLDGKALQHAALPAHGSLILDYAIFPTEEETAAGLLTRTVTATALDGALEKKGTLSFALRDGNWHLETGWPGLTVTAGEVITGWDEEQGAPRYIASVRVENTGDLPLSLYAESRDGSGAEAGSDTLDGWGGSVDPDDFQPGESFTFYYVMTESSADRMDGVMRRTLNVGGFVEETEAYVTGSASFVFPVLNEGALHLAVDGYHRSGGPDQSITVDLSLTNHWNEPIPVIVAAQDGNGNVPAGDALKDWPQGGSVTLAPDETRDFGYVIHPTQDEIANGEVQRTIIADGGEEPFLSFVTLTYPLVPEEGETAILHLEGSMQSGSPLALNDAFNAYLTATNLGNVEVEDVVIHGIAQSADGKTLAQLTLGASGDGNITAPGEGLQCFPCFPVTPDMAVAALSAHCVNEHAQAGAVTFTFWAQYTRRYSGGGIAPDVSNLVSFTVPILEDKTGGIFLSGLPSAASLLKEGDPVDIHLVIENIGKEDLVGLKLDVQRSGESSFSFLQTLIDEPLDIIHPGETRPYDFHYSVTPQDADAGFFGFKFVASSESGVRAMMYVSTYEFSQLLSPPEPSDMGGTILIAKHQDNLPPNGQSAFQLNDAIHYTIELTNTYGFPVTNIAVYDDMVGYSPVLVGAVDLESGQTKFVSFTHPVTALDASMLQVENQAYALVVVNDPQTGELMEDYSVWSDPVITPVDRTDEEDEGIAVSITKAAAGAPKNSQGYQEGETIKYDIVVHNGHSVDAEVEIWDYVWGSEAPELVDAVTLKPDETRNFTCAHTVSKADADAGSVTNEAYAGVLLRFSEDEEDITGYTVWAPPVTVPTIPTKRQVTDPPPVTPPVTEAPLIPPITVGTDITPAPDITPRPGEGIPQPGEEDFCRRVLMGYSDSETHYELILCEKHQSVDNAAHTLPFPEAKTLWIQAVNEAYDALAAKYPGDAALIDAERTVFLDQLDRHEALLAIVLEETQAADAVLRQLRERCLDLCYALHTAPEKRLDSLLHTGIPSLPLKGSPALRCAAAIAPAAGGYRTEETVCRDHLSIPGALGAQLRAAAPEEYAKAFRQARRLWQSALMDEANRLYPSLTLEGKTVLADDLNQFHQWVQARQALLLALYPQEEGTAEEVLAFMVRTRAMEMEALAR